MKVPVVVVGHASKKYPNDQNNFNGQHQQAILRQQQRIFYGAAGCHNSGTHRVSKPHGKEEVEINDLPHLFRSKSTKSQWVGIYPIVSRHGIALLRQARLQSQSRSTNLHILSWVSTTRGSVLGYEGFDTARVCQSHQHLVHQAKLSTINQNVHNEDFASQK
jgi:hypothetical protein